MIDMGKSKGTQVWFTGGRSIRELMEAGEIIALPDPETGMIFKIAAKCTELERRAALTIEEAQAIENSQNQ